jgi:hypothetical protein
MPWTKRCCGIPGRLRMNKLPSIPETFDFFHSGTQFIFLACIVQLCSMPPSIIDQEDDLHSFDRDGKTKVLYKVRHCRPCCINNTLKYQPSCHFLPFSSQPGWYLSPTLSLPTVSKTLVIALKARFYSIFNIHVQAPSSWRSSLGATSLITKSFKTSIMVIQR